MTSRYWQSRPAAFFSVLVLALGLAFGAAAAPTDPPPPRVPLDAATIRQKAVYVDHLATRSVSAATIEKSGDAAARADLAAARDLIAKAQTDLGAGNLAKADDELNQALALINARTRNLSQSRVTNERLQEAYDKRRKAVRTFIVAYDRVAKEKGKTSSAAKQSEALSRMADEADKLAAAGKLADAKVRLDEAYALTTKQLREMRSGDKLVRSLKFETPKDEYDYEIDRNDSHFMLLKIAAGEASPPRPDTPETQRLRSTAEALRKTAERQSGGGDYKAAIKSLEQSTGELLKAIRANGLFVPG
jgi:tetratricopeptide (TPR) repeat protein